MYWLVFLSIVDLGIIPFQILQSFIEICHYYNIVFYDMHVHTHYTMKHVSFGPHLIQQIMVSGRQWSVPSSSTVASTRDL